jgi:hypothetical protein
MAQECKVCTSADGGLYVNDELSKGASLKQLSATTGLTTSSLGRHSRKCYRVWKRELDAQAYKADPANAKKAKARAFANDPTAKAHIVFEQRSLPKMPAWMKDDPRFAEPAWPTKPPAKMGPNDVIFRVVFDQSDRFASKNPQAYADKDHQEALLEHRARGFGEPVCHPEPLKE